MRIKLTRTSARPFAVTLWSAQLMPNTFDTQWR
jgi:hypothetical protein